MHSKEEKVALAEKAYQIAYAYDERYGCCPQCVLAAVQETIGGIDDSVIKAAHALAGGGGLSGEGTCGAMAGGQLALGAYFGRDRNQEGFGNGRFLKSYQYSKQLYDKFKDRYDCVSCNNYQKEFTGKHWDFWKEEESKEFKTLRKNKCAMLTGEIAQWVVEKILNLK